MHEPASLQNGLARMMTGVFRALNPNKWLIGIAALLAVALLAVLVPAVVLAAPTDAPSNFKAVSGDGNMTLSWDTLDGASGGYEYRYSADFGSLVTAFWTDHGSSSGDTSVTFDPGTEDVGTLYYFQVRGQDSDGNTGPEAQVSATQRVVPPAVPNLQAVAGNAKVTLTWDDFDLDYLIGNYQYRQNSGGVWSSWTTTISYTKD